MNDKVLSLDIEINYEDKKFIKNIIKQINLDKLIKESIKKFNIEPTREKNLYFYYIDDEDDINRINSVEDIYICAKNKPNSEEYKSLIYLDIDENKSNFQNNKSENNSNNFIEEKKLKQYYEKINREKEEKIKKLEEKIEKMKKEHLEELEKIKKMENSEKKSEKLNTNIIKNEMGKLEKIILELFNK